MSALLDRYRAHRDAARGRRAVERAMRTIASRAVRAEFSELNR